jgi:hypothetical protein
LRRAWEGHAVRLRSSILGTLAVAAGVALVARDARAGKPGGGVTESGLVHFARQGALWTMRPDGTGKAPMPSGVTGEPSRALHAGHRWFLEVLLAPGEVTPLGHPAYEVFAIRDDGALVRAMTTQPDLGVRADRCMRWAPGDTAISFTGRRFQGGAFGAPDVYVASVVYDAAGDVAGLAAQPSAPAATIPGGGVSHDWSPDALRLVVGGMDSSGAGGALWIATPATGTATRLLTTQPAFQPRWSPDGARIAYELANENGIRTVAADGSSDVSVVAPSRPGSTVFSGQPSWSPGGAYLIFLRGGSILANERWDVFRIAANGTGATNLTGDLDTRASSGTPTSPVGWR